MGRWRGGWRILEVGDQSWSFECQLPDLRTVRCREKKEKKENSDSGHA